MHTQGFRVMRDYVERTGHQRQHGGKDGGNGLMERDTRPKYYECGGCDCWHREEFAGGCRTDNERFSMDELDEKHGGYGGWVAVEPGHAQECICADCSGAELTAEND